MAGASFAPRSGRGLKPIAVGLAVARDMEDMAGTLARLRLLLGLVCAVATVVSAVILTWIVRLGLRPVDRLAREIGGVGEDNLSARVHADGAPAELRAVVGRLNDLLGRLEGAFERERAFSADVAHELRTPLAGLRTTLEVAVAGEHSLAGFEQGLRESLGISCQMSAMVENLLAMARCETGREEVACERVHLAGLLRECWRDLAGPAAERRLKVEWQLDEACELATDREKLGLIVRNLLANAVAYADEGGSVVVEAAPQEGSVTVRVSNTGSALTAEQAGHVFQRFWQGDKARSATGVHCGLGLALCERLATLLGGSIAAVSERGGEFAVTLILPALASIPGHSGAAPAESRAEES
jgi:two-component system sensor histidine kinase QseC